MITNSVFPAFAATPNWNVSGSWIFDYHYNGGVNLHDMTLNQDPTGAITGSGGAFSGVTPYQYPWTIDNGQVDGDSITFTAHYTATVNCSFTATGIIASGGSMSGTWTDNCDGNRDGTWATTQGAAIAIAAPDVCPVGTTQSSSPIETLPVNSASSLPTSSSNSLSNGTNYLLVSSGTWQNNNLNAADTEYASVDSWSTVMDGYNINPYFLGEGEFDLQINGSFVNWGAYNTGHTYSHLYAGTSSPVNFLVFDGDSNNIPAINPGWYGDNSGSLSVNIYSCNPNIVPPVGKDQCKKGGWTTMVDGSGHHFKNQGDCVSYFATGGKNPGAL